MFFFFLSLFDPRPPELPPLSRGLHSDDFRRKLENLGGNRMSPMLLY
jgi:hypothetical protein